MRLPPVSVIGRRCCRPFRGTVRPCPLRADAGGCRFRACCSPLPAPPPTPTPLLSSPPAELPVTCRDPGPEPPTPCAHSPRRPPSAPPPRGRLPKGSRRAQGPWQTARAPSMKRGGTTLRGGVAGDRVGLFFHFEGPKRLSLSHAPLAAGTSTRECVPTKSGLQTCWHYSEGFGNSCFMRSTGILNKIKCRVSRCRLSCMRCLRRLRGRGVGAPLSPRGGGGGGEVRSRCAVNAAQPRVVKPPYEQRI